MCENVAEMLARLTRTILLGAIAVASCCLASQLTGLAESPTAAHHPKIAFDASRYDFGKTKEGIKVRHVFKVFNRGDAPLKIDKVMSSCGCTVPKMKAETVGPGQAEDLEVIMDTSLKQGAVTKEILVFSNDPATPKAIVQVAANVEDLHKSLTKAERGKLFQGKCAWCHWKVGIGLEGGDLYRADCGMCHGETARGAVGPALVPRNYDDAAVSKHVTQVTSYGSKRHVSMPGFLVDVGGPLTEREIASIVKYLAEQSKADKKKG
jgi:hypothetical protein